MVSDGDDRAQLLLIGAITLAFIILGVVVVFNGVLYTETLSSGGTSQSASNADAVELEVEQGVGCLLKEVNNDTSTISLLDDHAEDNISTFSDSYRNRTVRSTSAAVTVRYDGINITGSIDDVNIIVTYDTNELHFKREMTVGPGDCPT
ncbi:hypothetical protein [Natrinema sp. 1APR25-10V2]|uniref:hypothetical protein n=1 Tax=Natrinema sp. 1APR25-10V2 TaxID=2951081 RepID=UPI002876AC9D|nr:hypothetical protein [Natrinema sp. 1APR25-10V2]MDS0474134.1 hypothetical protein [Natrinema sp. 1APR25-10V2]